MDLKPIVTNFGDDKLYIPLSKEIERRLPLRSVEWRRSFGRSAKTVCLKASFTRYNSETLGGTSEGSVNKQPFLHIYWTACMENDDFRNGIKQRITNWQQNLKSQDISDWLIIQVVSQETRASRTKITLPRSSVFDKIKNDICGRNASRCVQLWEPDKETLLTKAAESWEALVSQLRELLLGSISQHLTKFEEKVRKQREKYAEPDWSFIDYLKLNEELATILKSVTLHEDALIQYDELDALFSQFVVNGKIKGKPIWLEHFTKRSSCWDGISLHKQAVKFFRDLVYDGKATLLELRNYIFIRQWQMLAKIYKDCDAVHRLLEFLFTVVNEMKVLQVGCPDFVPACWVISTCLEFVKIFEKKEITDRSTIACLAQICDFAREKLLLLGESFELLPSDTPSNPVGEVMVGLCRSYQVKDESTSGSKSLMIGLTSKAEFEKLYLHVCERTKAFYTNVGRHRFAMKVAIDIAKFSLLQKNYNLAEAYLERALHTFGQQHWEVLHIDVLEPLAKCLCKHELIERYLWSLACLSCTKALTYKNRLHYAELFLNITEKNSNKSQVISAEPLLSLEDVKIDLVKEIGHIGEIVTVILQIRSNLPLEFQCDGMEIRLRYTKTDQVRLSEVDAEITSTTPTTKAAKWSEVFQKASDDNVTNSERKLGLLKRIRSRKIAKPTETCNSIDINIETSLPVENCDIVSLKQAHSSAIVDRRCDSNSSMTSNPDKTPITLAEIAKGIPFSREVSDDQLSEATPNAFDYSRILSDAIGKRSDSVSSSLSNVSIVSEPTETTAENSSKTSNGGCLDISKEEVEFCIDASDGCNAVDPPETKNSGMQNGITDLSNNAVINDVDAVNGTFKIINPLQIGNNESAAKNALDESDTLDSGGILDIAVAQQNAINAGSLKKSEAENGPQNDQVEENVQNNIEELLEIEEELEVVPAQKLTSSGIILQPGLNVVPLTAKVLHEGRYSLQSLSCEIGNVTLYHLLLGLPRKSRAFFVISDPPKFTWTSAHLAECLLLGSKQRVHVTLSNGPGFIPASSALRISTTTGLEFSAVSPSSVFVYSPNKKDEPKEGAMQIELDSSVKHSAVLYLPECGSYEMIDLFFDVTAPVQDTNLFGHMAKHEVSLECLWLNEVTNAVTKLESIFYEPFDIQHEFSISSEGEFVQSILRNMNPVQITIQKPELHCLNSDCISFMCITCDVPMNINANEDLSLIWSVKNHNKVLKYPSTLQCQLNIEFKTEEQEEYGAFCKKSEISYVKPLLVVEICFQSEDNRPLCKGSPCQIEVTVRWAFNIPDACIFDQILCTLEENEQWIFNDEAQCKKCENELKEEGKMKFVFEIIPCASGKLEYPRISLWKATGNDVNNSEQSITTMSTELEDRVQQSRSNRTVSALAMGKLLSRRRSANTSDCKAFADGEIVFVDFGKFLDVDEPEKRVTDV